MNNMTNEEKVEELFNSEIGRLDTNDFDKEFEIKSTMIAVAEWKDQQFKEYLKKKREEYEEEYYGKYSYQHIGDRITFLDEIINELFNE